MRDDDSRKFLNPKKLNSHYLEGGEKRKFWSDKRNSKGSGFGRLKTEGTQPS